MQVVRHSTNTTGWALVALGLATAMAAPGSAAAFGPAKNGAEPPSLVRQALGYVDRLYVEPGRVDPGAMLEGALRSLEREYPAVIVDRRKGASRAVVSVDSAARPFDLAGAASLPGVAAAIDQVLAFLATHPAALGPRADEAAYTALRGALGTLDPHTQAFSPRQAKDFQTQTRGTFGGVGFMFSVVPEGVLVGEVLAGTPAARSGLKPGDRVTSVDGIEIAGFTTAEVVELVRGDPGTEVVLGLAASGSQAARAVTAVRAVIVSKSVRSAVLDGAGLAPVVHATVERFQKDTTTQLQAVIDAAPDGTAGIVLDLRGNPGGMLDEAVAVADLFLDDGVIVETRERSRPPKVFRAGGFGVVRRQLPVVVLISRSSASASEVVAAALRPSRAVLVGERSFGKGSVQQMYPLTDGGGLLLTIRHYVTPDEVSIQARGIEPDLLLEPVVVEDRTILGAPAVHGREADLKQAFGVRDGSGKAPEARWRLPYLLEAAPALGSAGPTTAERADPLRDAALRTAASLLRAAHPGRADRATLMAAAGTVVGRVAAEEEGRIVAAFAARGVDWTAGPDNADMPALRVEPLGEVLLEGGASAKLTVRVSNPGPRAARRVWGVTTSSNPLVSGLAFAFGAIAPGQAREASVSVPVPAWSWARWDPWTLTLRGGGRGSAEGAARTAAGRQPSLAFSYRLSDVNDTNPAHSGDGILSGGERLTLRIRPVGGGGDPDSLVVRVAPERSGRIRLERRERTIEFFPGASDTEFGGVVAGDPGPEPLRLAVSVSGRSFGKVLDDRIEIPLGAPYEAGSERHPPEMRALEPVPDRTSRPQVTLRVALTDDSSVKDVYVLVGDRKVFYRSFGRDGAPPPLEVSIPLEEGSNRIEVVARDGDDLHTRRSFFVYRTAAAGPG